MLTWPTWSTNLAEKLRRAATLRLQFVFVDHRSPFLLRPKGHLKSRSPKQRNKNRDGLAISQLHGPVITLH
jgi:hypothetical protein